MNHNAVWFCRFTIQEQQDVSRSVRWCTLRTLSGKMNFNVIIFQCGWYRGIIVYLALKERRRFFRAFFYVMETSFPLHKKRSARIALRRIRNMSHIATRRRQRISLARFYFINRKLCFSNISRPAPSNSKRKEKERTIVWNL